MNFIDILKQKAFNRYNISAIYIEEYNSYNISSYYGTNLQKINEDFFNHLKNDLELPLDKKSLHFSFNRNEFKGFKNACFQSVVKQNPSIEEFDNYFHSFYKNIPINDLFNAAYIKSDYNGKPIKNSIYQPYITYFLKQNFNHQNLYPDNFIKVLHFNFHTTEDNYPDLKESLYAFLSTHVENVKNKFKNTYNNEEYAFEQIKKFENSLYDSISKFIKPQDMKLFSPFWPHILIKSNNENMITPINNVFVFDLNYAYLSDIYPQVTNESIARKTCQFIHNTVNSHLSDFLTSHIVCEEPSYSRFLINFKKSLNKESIPDIIDKCIELKIKSNQFEDYYLKPQYKSIYEDTLENLKKEVNYLDLNSQLPSKNIIIKKNKI